MLPSASRTFIQLSSLLQHPQRRPLLHLRDDLRIRRGSRRTLSADAVTRTMPETTSSAGAAGGGAGISGATTGAGGGGAAHEQTKSKATTTDKTGRMGGACYQARRCRALQPGNPTQVACRAVAALTFAPNGSYVSRNERGARPAANHVLTPQTLLPVIGQVHKSQSRKYFPRSR